MATDLSCRSNRSSFITADHSENSERSTVSFGTVEFHEHKVVLGDNPSTSCGPSIEIDWTQTSSAILEVDEYESHRLPRRTSQQLVMPNRMRTDMLLDNGYSLREIRESTAKRKESLAKNKTSMLPKKLINKLRALK